VPGADEDALVAACRERGVVLDGAAQHGASGDGATLLISFAAVPDAAAGHVAALIATARDS
jgi:GntR family transcriptional regulator/MocR family aminotransferase